jgi:glycosyltransferase involved in cell wall biosynthesis
MQMKPKLLVLTSTFPRWRNDTDPPFVFELSRRLTRTFDVTVHAPHYPGAATRETMEGMTVHRFRYFFAPLEKLAGTTGILPTLRHNRFYSLLVPFFLVAQFCSILVLIKKLRPALIHAHWLIPQGFFAVAAKKIFGVPVVVTAHGADVFGLQNWLCNALKRFAGTGADSVTVVSEALKDALAAIFPQNITVDIIPMGVDAGLFAAGTDKNKHPTSPRLLFVGRLTEKKGVKYLINAMPEVLKRYPDAELIVVGSGELEKRLQEQVKILGLQNSVFFAGSVSNSRLPGYYASADIFIGPSIQAVGGDREGFGLTFVEAAMSGCLVIATNTGGIKDIIQDGSTGLLVPEQDSNALAAKILYALEHRQEVEKIKAEGQRRCIEKYDWSVIYRQYEKVFFQLLDFPFPGKDSMPGSEAAEE